MTDPSPLPDNPAKPKFCTECLHRLQMKGKGQKPECCCAHPKLLRKANPFYLVNGDDIQLYHRCVHHRSAVGECGAEGKFWEPLIPTREPRVFRFKSEQLGHRCHVTILSAKSMKHSFTKLGDLVMDLHDWLAFQRMVLTYEGFAVIEDRSVDANYEPTEAVQS